MEKLFKTILWLGILSMGGQAFAQGERAEGGGVGNGGWAVVCRDAEKRITSAELLDIYEGRELYGQTYSSEKVESSVRVKRVGQLLGKFPLVQRRLSDELFGLYAHWTYVDKDNELERTSDALPIIKKKGCEFEQVANYLDSGEFFVSEEIYFKFDALSKAALEIHEAFYSMYRWLNPGKVANSRDSRKLTAHLIAENPDMVIIEELLAKHSRKL